MVSEYEIVYRCGHKEAVRLDLSQIARGSTGNTVEEREAWHKRTARTQFCHACCTVAIQERAKKDGK